MGRALYGDQWYDQFRSVDGPEGGVLRLTALTRI
jgi:hypothetical protein